MTAVDIFNQFIKLTPEEQENFIGSLSLWCDIHLPDGEHLIISKAEFVQLTAARGWIENPALYEIAKKVTLDAGYPWTDPRSGMTFNP